jgi:4-hydroxy-2-oxoheptanedioate aldolase
MGFPNRLKQVLEEGRVAFGASIQIPAPALVEILGLVGYDFTMIDAEHGLFDMQAAGELLRAAHGAGLTPLLRVSKNDPALILKALDLGAQGVIIPHVSSKAEAVQAVDASKYGGSRGACPLVRAAGYGLWSWKDYQRQADQETLVIVLIEDLQGAENIEDILSAGGIDIVFLGPFDMSVSAGYEGNVRHPVIQTALDRILTACKQQGIPVMHALTGGPDVEEWVNRGVRLILQSADSVVFARAHKAFLDSVAQVRNKKVA